MGLRLGFMGTPEFAVPALAALAKHHHVEIVVSQPDRPKGRGLEVIPTPVKSQALSHGFRVEQPDKLDADFETLLHSLKLDVIVVVAFGRILKQSVLNIPLLGCINIHASLLPRWRGAAPIQWSILAGDPETGVTTMQMETGLDTGPIFEIARTPIGPEETAADLSKRLSILGGELIVSTLAGLSRGALSPIPQPSGATYAAKLTKDMGQLSSAESARELHRKVRAFTPWPGTSVMVGSPQKRLKILSAQLAEDSVAPGVVQCRGDRVLFGAQDGCLELLNMQWEGKKPVGPKEFIAAWQA